MTVSVDVEVARRPDALVLPSNTVRDPLSDRPWVLVAENGRATRRDVTLGLAGGGRVQVEKGIQPSDLVIPVRAAVAEGERLRPRPVAPADSTRPESDSGSSAP